jgi:hypothetical protein
MAIADRENSCKEMMKALVLKYPEGYEGWAEENGEKPVERSYAKI